MVPSVNDSNMGSHEDSIVCGLPGTLGKFLTGYAVQQIGAAKTLRLQSNTE